MENIISIMIYMVAHGLAVACLCQITEVKQRGARLALGWVTCVRVMPPAMCRGVGSYHASSIHSAPGEPGYLVERES